MQDPMKRKRSVLNKFVSKTYHMIDQCDPSIASWSAGGDSFTVKDAHSFEKDVLPRYFNHSKFSSFIRQLNFYGFQKLRSDPDLQQVHSKSVRFSHEYFKKGQPELLHKIQRSTAAAHVTSSDSTTIIPADQVQFLHHQIACLRQQVKTLEEQMDDKVEAAERALEANCLARINNLEASYKGLLTTLIPHCKQGISSSVPSRTWLTTSPQWQHSSSNMADYIRSDHAP